ncbi:MAG: prolipoprotein diacylglyceryl transferase [Bacteroidales bacterium]|nr:prolipoprotein diacylglyceryl transferase [Bacteroidales bacterium]
MLSFISWNADPVLFHIGPLAVRWYGLMFAIGFMVGYMIMSRMFKHEGVPEKWLDILLVYLVVSTVIGARLGHVLFYEWDYYSSHPAEILKVWEGGLASHGATVGIFLGLCIFSWCTAHKNPSWVIDKVVVPIALVGGLVRLGNLMNSEIYGDYTTLPWGFIFVRNGETLPAHPTQIYEALCYFALFGLLWWMYWKRNAEERPWLMTGVFFIWTFGTRFLIEYIKNPQESWEADMVLNMGQLLSIPFILIGIGMVAWAMSHPRQHWTFPNHFAETTTKSRKK